MDFLLMYQQKCSNNCIENFFFAKFLARKLTLGFYIIYTHSIAGILILLFPPPIVFKLEATQLGRNTKSHLVFILIFPNAFRCHRWQILNFTVILNVLWLIIWINKKFIVGVHLRWLNFSHHTLSYYGMK